MLEAKITHIFPKQRIFKNPSRTCFLIKFELSNGEWAKMEICSGFANYKRWKKAINEGSIIYNFKMKDRYTIDFNSDFKVRNWPTISLDEELQRLFSEQCL